MSTINPKTLRKIIKMIQKCYAHQNSSQFGDSFHVDSHLETKLSKNCIEKQNTPGNKRQVKGKHSLFLPVSWSIKPS